MLLLGLRFDTLLSEPMKKNLTPPCDTWAIREHIGKDADMDAWLKEQGWVFLGYSPEGWELFGPAPKTYTVAQAAALAGVSYSAMTQACRTNRVPGAWKPGRDWLIPEAGLQWYVEHPAKFGRPPKTSAATASPHN